MKLTAAITGFLIILLISSTPFAAKAGNTDQIFTIDTKQEHTLVSQSTVLVTIKFLDSNRQLISNLNAGLDVCVNGKIYPVQVVDGSALLKIEENKKIRQLEISLDKKKQVKTTVYINRLHPLFSLLPPIVAILLAIVFKEVIIALFAGVYLGILLLLNPANPISYLKAPLVFAGDYLIRVLTNPDKISVIVFSLMIGGMVGILIRNGSMQALVMQIASRIRSRRRAQFITWLMGIIIFFDDYANTLIVGNSLRPLTDKFKISREKLSYIVDSTAAPVASIAMITTWIGAQINYITDATTVLGIQENPYSIFLGSLQYSFYPLITLFFIAMLIWTKRDFGPMLYAEKLAIHDFDKLIRDRSHPAGQQAVTTKNSTIRWYDAVIPVAVLIILAFCSLLFYKSSWLIWHNPTLSFSSKIMHVIGGADPFRALLWASFCGLSIAAILSVIKRSLKIKEVIEGMMSGINSMLIAMIILILAWSLGILTIELGTDVYLSGLLSKHFQPFLIPALVFVIAAAISFATGSSWGTMALLYPLILPAAYNTCIANEMPVPQTMHIFYMVVSAVLGGSVFGDHCSPISDTTILSSMSSSCNHIYHVRTQLPYAVTVALSSVVFGYLMSAWLNLSSIVGYLLSILTLTAMILLVGKQPGKSQTF